MANFGPVDRGEIQETTKIEEHNFYIADNFTNKDNLHTAEVEIQDKKYAILAAMLRKPSYFV